MQKVISTILNFSLIEFLTLRSDEPLPYLFEQLDGHDFIQHSSTNTHCTKF
jgi:hypothetical protein